MAERVGTTLKSERSAELLEQGGEEAPPVVKEARDNLSLIQKMRKLTDEKLDAAIQKYDQSWKGGDEEETERKIVQLEEQYKQSMASGAQLMLQGAIPVFNASGTNVDGNYSVLVGMVWSPRMANLAQAVINPRVEMEKGPKGRPIREKIQARLDRNPNYLANTQGIRVWNTADGSKVLVSFAPVHRTSSTQRNGSKAALAARSGSDGVTDGETADAAEGDGSGSGLDH